ncbi:MAG: 3-keto-5-aminohexanoate cleavage protein [Rhodospirillales bacterium]|nr:3-keto-5-aminohexanoate cleavage protein [Rhodospirillales bacterium]
MRHFTRRAAEVVTASCFAFAVGFGSSAPVTAADPPIIVPNLLCPFGCGVTESDRMLNTTMARGGERVVLAAQETPGYMYNIRAMAELQRRGVLDGQLHFSLVMGIQGDIPASPANLLAMLDALPEGSSWQIVGIGKHQPPVLAVSNAQLVERAVRIARELGREIATPEEARQILHMAPAPEPPVGR